MKKLLWIPVTLGLATLVACASGNCRSQVQKDPKEAQMKANPTSPSERVSVYKYDGSLQCGQGKAIDLAKMATELKGITIYSQTSKNDGLMHIQQCGTPTGKANVYEIDRKDLALAQKAGFKEWTWE